VKVRKTRGSVKRATNAKLTWRWGNKTVEKTAVRCYTCDRQLWDTKAKKVSRLEIWKKNQGIRGLQREDILAADKDGVNYRSKLTGNVGEIGWWGRDFEDVHQYEETLPERNIRLRFQEGTSNLEEGFVTGGNRGKAVLLEI